MTWVRGLNLAHVLQPERRQLFTRDSVAAVLSKFISCASKSSDFKNRSRHFGRHRRFPNNNIRSERQSGTQKVYIAKLLGRRASVRHDAERDSEPRSQHISEEFIGENCNGEAETSSTTRKRHMPAQRLEEHRGEQLERGWLL
jgi:hypothetical protein